MLEFPRDASSNNDRTSQEYYERCTSLAYSAGSVVFSVKAEQPPENLTELLEIVNLSDGHEPLIAYEIDQIIALISSSEDPDELVKALPYYEGDLVLLLPEL
jgi:hypothetical protein